MSGRDGRLLFKVFLLLMYIVTANSTARILNQHELRDGKIQNPMQKYHKIPTRFAYQTSRIKNNYSQVDDLNSRPDNWRPLTPEEVQKLQQEVPTKPIAQARMLILGQGSYGFGEQNLPGNKLNINNGIQRHPSIIKIHNFANEGLQFKQEVDVSNISGTRNPRIMNRPPRPSVVQTSVEIVKPVYEDVDESVKFVEVDLHRKLDGMLKEFEVKLKKILDSATVTAGEKLNAFQDDQLNIRNHFRVQKDVKSDRQNLQLEQLQRLSDSSNKSISVAPYSFPIGRSPPSLPETGNAVPHALNSNPRTGNLDHRREEELGDQGLPESGTRRVTYTPNTNAHINNKKNPKTDEKTINDNITTKIRNIEIIDAKKKVVNEKNNILDSFKNIGKKESIFDVFGKDRLFGAESIRSDAVLNNHRVPKSVASVMGQEGVHRGYNSPGHLPFDPFVALFLSHYGKYSPHVSGGYPNLYSYLASNNIHNNKPFGSYKIYGDA